MDEILYELREHSAGLNARPLGSSQLHQEASQQPDFCLADRALVTMTTHF